MNDVCSDLINSANDSETPKLQKNICALPVLG